EAAVRRQDVQPRTEGGGELRGLVGGGRRGGRVVDAGDDDLGHVVPLLRRERDPGSCQILLAGRLARAVQDSIWTVSSGTLGTPWGRRRQRRERRLVAPAVVGRSISACRRCAGSGRPRRRARPCRPRRPCPT